MIIVAREVRLCTGLQHNQRQVAMSRHLLHTPRPDLVQRSLPFEPSIYPLHGLALLQKSLTFQGVLYSICIP